MNGEITALEVQSIWDRAKTTYITTLLSEDDKAQADRYFLMISKVYAEKDTFIIATKNSYAAELLEKEYANQLRNCIELFSGGRLKQIKFTIDEMSPAEIIVPRATAPAPVDNSKAKKDGPKEKFVSTMPLLKDYTFEEFVQGPSNSFAFAAAQAVASNPGKGGYNPLFIHGGTGLGKTHLMQAIGNEIIKKDPNLFICYLTAEEYLNEYVNYMKDNRVPDFRQKYRKVDVLLIDDVQFFNRKAQIQEEFFNTFNALHQANKQIVMTSDVAPKNMPEIEARLVSRFEWGMLQEIEAPSYETRIAILKKKLEGIEVNVPIKAIEFIADKINSHVRAMEGALRKVTIYLKAYPQTVLTNEILSHLLSDFIQKEQNLKKLNVEEIQAAVAKKYGVTIAQILSSERTQSIVTPRQLSMYIARKYTTKSLPEIAKLFDKSHATIIHGVKNIEKRLDVEDDLKNMLAEILTDFGCNLSDKVD